MMNSVTGELGAADARALPFDAMLPGMTLLHRPAALRELLGERLAHWLAPMRVVDTRVEVRHLFPGKRCSAELELVLGPAAGGAAGTRRVLGKFYSDDQGAAVFENLSRLREHGFNAGRFLVPRPLAYDPPHRLLLLEWTDGQSLQAALVDSTRATESVDSAAAWLVRLHQSGLTTGRQYTRSRHVHTLMGWMAQLADVYPEGRPFLADLGTRIRDRSHVLRVGTSGPTHRDFTAEHLIASGAQLVGLDLDEFCQYDPLFDVAHFRAHLRYLGLTRFGVLDHFDPLAARFVASYAASGGDDSEERRNLYEAMSYVKLSRFVALVRRPPGWRQILPTLLDQAASSLAENVT
jgi:hypothetical protein